MCAIPVVPGFSLVRKAVANDGSLLFLITEESASRSLLETHKTSFGIFPRTRADAATPLRLLRVTPETSDLIELPELELTFPLVDAFPDGRILVVGPRCDCRSKDDYDLNGAIIQPQTGQVTRILLGDGIDSVQIDSLGRIWVGYFDEGVFGNFGWGGRDGPAPVGCSGLACFSGSGKKIWEFPANPTYAISDCYALNVSGADAAIFFYTDFPLCKINGKFELTYWTTKLAGCHAFAISGTEVLFSGQYNDPPDAAYLGRLDPREGLARTRWIRLLMPDGSSRSGGKLLGRGKSLYHFDDENVCRVSLD
jgi:hypothetical protein